jgi:RNA polymerase sigma-70 factor (ECF subfamily)
MKSLPELGDDARGLVQACDALELERLVQRELPRVERLLVRMLGQRGDLQDLVQTVFLEVCRALPRYRGESTLSTFVGGITVHVAQRAMRPRALFRLRAPLGDELPSPSPSPEHGARRERTMQHMRRALERIAPKKRIPFCLWALEGMEPAEIATLTGASLSATRSRIFYAQKELRALAERDPVLCEALLGEAP